MSAISPTPDELARKAKEQEAFRAALEEQEFNLYSGDNRGGNFTIIKGKRVHEDDLPSAKPIPTPPTLKPASPPDGE